MSKSTDLLDHVTELVPAPVGTLEQLFTRQQRRDRRKRLAAGVLVVAVWLVIGLVVLVSLASKDDTRPAEPVPDPNAVAAFPLHETSVVPAAFPSSLPLPDGAQPVAARATRKSVPQATETKGHSVQVWFRSDRDPAALRADLERSLPGNGWAITRDKIISGSVWDLHAESDGMEVSFLGKINKGTGLVIHGSYLYDGKWEFYVVVTFLSPDRAS